MARDEFTGLLRTARQIMKAQKVTYAILAKRIGVSEATIKRVFTSSDASFSRVIEICEAIGVPFAELVQQSQETKEKVFVLSEAQERFLAEHPDHFAFFFELVEENLSPEEIRAKYRLNAASMRHYLRDLERLGILERFPGNRIQLKVDGTHSWRDGGPLQKKYLRQDHRAFVDHLSTRFLQDRHFLTSSDRFIHPDTFEAFLAELRSLAGHYRKRAYRDEISYPKKDLIAVKWLIGAAPYRREPLVPGNLRD